MSAQKFLLEREQEGMAASCIWFGGGDAARSWMVAVDTVITVKGIFDQPFA
jgi:hypothetical protein